ncbi:MAG: sigma-54-dependent Fis family transcriptional regulator [candidate division WOR-3 bacterium]|nr:MAG: sigma-54-dependent Fis family transcriptional regulator [candidate division WOR-3 bacterium]
MNSIRILIVEDERSQRVLLKKILEKDRYSVDTVDTGKQAIKAFGERDYDCVLLDQRLPDMNGLEILERLKTTNPIIPVIIMTAYANVTDAVKAMKQGAFHYLTKPVSTEELMVIIGKAVETMELKRENIELRKSLEEKYRYDKIIYTSSRMEQVMSFVLRAAKSDANVLITGESGTGKELVAGAIHHLSNRRQQNFVTAHLAALPETLIEAELFGHERGAFTGAEKRRIGKFEFATRGTLFLDEIGELPQSIQIKLLRIIQEKRIVRLGSNEELPVDTRLICATNKILEEAVKQGTFREDLYYRLNVIQIHVPPLRERKEDIPLLIDHFIRTHAEKNRKKIKGITAEAMKYLMKYNFPGNIRELENIIERAIVFARREQISIDDIPVVLFSKTTGPPVGGLEETVSTIEKQMITEALKKNGGNKSKAAVDLGVSERVLRYKIKKYKITP